MLFILWLIYPHSEGAAFLYNKFVNPTLTNHEQEIDSAIGLAQKEATNKSIELSRQGLNTLQQIAYDALIKGQNLLGNQINLATSLLLQQQHLEKEMKRLALKQKETKEKLLLLNNAFGLANYLTGYFSKATATTENTATTN
ncbi:13884_t:CDS:2 [Entrophospora sp. SA101]|nr:13884_t:CDS:2 [Entrophospora sp. SA101]